MMLPYLERGPILRLNVAVIERWKVSTGRLEKTMIDSMDRGTRVGTKNYINSVGDDQLSQHIQGTKHQ